MKFCVSGLGGPPEGRCERGFSLEKVIGLSSVKTVADRHKQRHAAYQH